MKTRQPLLAVVFLGAVIASAVLWRRNAIELAEMKKQADAQAGLRGAPASPSGPQPALIEENHKQRPMTAGDLRGIVEKTMSDLKARPNDPQLHLQLAVALSLAKRFDNAADEVEKTARLAPRDAQVRGTAGMFYMRFGDAQAALPHLQKAHELAPSDLDSVINLARAHWARGEMDATLQLLEQASRLAGNSVGLQEQLAGVCTELPIRPNAVRAWRKVLALQPNHALALQQLAFYEMDGGNLATSKKLLQKALASAPNVGNLHSLMGTVYVLSPPTPDNLKHAETSLNKAVELAQTPDAGTHYYLGKVHQRRGELPKAAEQMEIAVKINPSYREAHYDLAQIYSELKRLDDAARERGIFQKIFQSQNHRNLVSRQCQTEPNNPQLQYKWAKLFLFDNNPVQALPHLQKALELRPDWKEVRQKVAELYRAMGRPRRAQDYSSTTHSDPTVRR